MKFTINTNIRVKSNLVAFFLVSSFVFHIFYKFMLKHLRAFRIKIIDDFSHLKKHIKEIKVFFRFSLPEFFEIVRMSFQ